MGAEEQGPQAGGPQGQPSEEELRQRLEEELRNLRVQDVLLQSVVSLINLTSRRIAKEDERDLEQARVGIEAVRALVDLLDAEPAGQVRNALSELQMHYASASGGGESPPEAPEEGGGGEAGDAPEPPPPPGSGGPGGQPPPKLWTPPGS
ncbi:MAG: hypothetical protein ACRDL3_04550 [Solirubrobacterales bacterium]